MNYKITCLILVSATHFFGYIYSNDCEASLPVVVCMDNVKSIQGASPYLVLEEMIAVVEMITTLSPEDQAKVVIECIQCKRTMSCAEFSGSLIADHLITKKNNDLEEFKKILLKKNAVDVQFFMKEVAHKNQIQCPTCKTFGWR